MVAGINTSQMAPPLKYKIHPAIGIARLGDSPDFFVGPEIPGAANASDIGSAAPPYKSGDQIKPQAARFRVFEYADNGKGYEVKREVNLSEADIDSLVWEVHVANRKASFFAFNGLAGFDRAAEPRRNGATNESKRKKLEIDPGPRTIFGKSKPPEDISKKNPKKESWPDPAPVPAITKLGRLATDKNGNLLVIGAEGLAVSRPGAAAINDYANNDGWFDDVFDGSVKAFLKFKGGKSIEAEPAWVICGPPDFAPALFNVVTLYDVLYDLAARELKLPGNEILFTTGELANLSKINSEFRKAGKAELSAYKPDFATEIFPILARADMMRFVFGPAASAHVLMAGQWNDLASNSSATAWRRQTVFNSLRPPDAKATDTKPDMPKLLGDEPEA
ncbi:MAG TPA: LodA/GoxA family CTQ-dependent oxidase, partial [Chryseosolibacter sp.]